jgi:hypothetical protein
MNFTACNVETGILKLLLTEVEMDYLVTEDLAMTAASAVPVVVSSNSGSS